MRLRASGPLPRIASKLNLEDRGVLWVEVEIDGLVVQVLNTHLSIHERERRLQVRELVGDRWLRHPECAGPVVLAGDFNASGDSYTARRIEEVLRNSLPTGQSGADHQTWSSRIPVRRIDHVFTSPQFRVRSVEVPRTRLTRVASDHLPFVVDLRGRSREPGGPVVGSS
jgi:endonuclease/exonuclease/phosphatase family metal-dependent hydrolase